MAYRTVVGIPGAGKTFYIVAWLAKHFCLELKDGGYVLDPSKNVRVVTNVAGLTIPHEDFRAALEEAGGFHQFFTKDYQRKFSRGFHIIYIFDEAQEWFHPKFCKLTHDNLLYFTWARHEGHDIFLLTQDIKLLVYDVACLSEYVVMAQPRTNNVSNELTYVYRTFDGTELRVERLFFSKQTASLYKSAEKGEAVKITNYRLRRYMAALAIAVLLMVFGFRSSYKYWNKFMYSADASKSSAPVVSGQAAVVQAPSAANSPSSPPASKPSGASGIVDAGTSSSRSSEFYMYLVDYAAFGSKVLFLLGSSWLTEQEYPYRLVKKGSSYYALMPGALVSSLGSRSRAVPLKAFSGDVDFTESKWNVLKKEAPKLQPHVPRQSPKQGVPPASSVKANPSVKG